MRFRDQAWAPSAFTRPLSVPFLSDGPRLIALLEGHFRPVDGSTAGKLIRLDDWQKALLCHALERYPADWPVERLRGRLRYRQVVVSMGRQNGKSILGAAFGLYGLVQHVAGPSVVGIATSVEQANVVYHRVAYAVRHDPALMARFKPSGTRGVRARDGAGGYFVKPALEEGLQSVPITLCIADELHLSRASMWDSIVNGQRAQADGLLVGITTAGDDSSVLLKRLYEQGADAIEHAGDDEAAQRFGFFLWQAPDGATIETPGAIEAANPAIACGRIPVETVRSDVAKLPRVDQERYTLNRFVANVSTWLDMQRWREQAGDGVPADWHGPVTFAVDRTPTWEWATITATVRLPQPAGPARLATEVVASIHRPSRAQLVAIGARLAEREPMAQFVMDQYQLGDVADALREQGVDVHTTTRQQVKAACAAAYAAIVSGLVDHAGDELLARQMPHAKIKTDGDGWRLVKAGSTDIDAVMATVLGLYGADVWQPAGCQLF